MTNFELLNIVTIKGRYRPTSFFYKQHPHPKIFKIEAVYTFKNQDYQFSDPPDSFQGISSVNFTAFNCPHNCLYCSDTEYPNGVCISCRKNFNLNSNLKICECSSKNSFEGFLEVNLEPDVSENTIFSQDDYVLDGNCLEFKSLESNFTSENQNATYCLKQILENWGKNLTSGIEKVTSLGSNFGSFYIKIWNIGNNSKLDEDCKKYVQAKTFLFKKTTSGGN